MTKHEVEYEVEQRGDSIHIVIDCEAVRKLIRHTASVRTAKQHPDGVEGYVEDKVETLACRRVEDEKKAKEETTNIPSSGTMSVDPSEQGNTPDELDSGNGQ